MQISRKWPESLHAVHVNYNESQTMRELQAKFCVNHDHVTTRHQQLRCSDHFLNHQWKKHGSTHQAHHLREYYQSLLWHVFFLTNSLSSTSSIAMASETLKGSLEPKLWRCILDATVSGWFHPVGCLVGIFQHLQCTVVAGIPERYQAYTINTSHWSEFNMTKWPVESINYCSYIA